MKNIFNVKNGKIVIDKKIAKKIKKYYTDTKEINEIKNNLLLVMEDNEITEMLSNGIYAKFTPEHTQNRFDTSFFKSNRPIIYKKYLKETNVSSSVSIKVCE